jgi:hypothetical protein
MHAMDGADAGVAATLAIWRTGRKTTSSAQAMSYAT